MNTNMTGFRILVFENLWVPVLWIKVASALEGLKSVTMSQTLDIWDPAFAKTVD